MQELQFWWNLKLHTNGRPWIQLWQNVLWFLKPVNIGTCHLLGHIFWPKIAIAPVLMKFCTLHKTRVVNSMISILRDAIVSCRELKLGIERQILAQKYYCYIINKVGKKLWLTSVKLFKLCQHSYLLKALTINELALEHIVKRNHY